MSLYRRSILIHHAYEDTFARGHIIFRLRRNIPPVSYTHLDVYKRQEFLAPLSLLMPAFSLLYNPPLLPVRLLLVYIAPLPIRFAYS